MWKFCENEIRDAACLSNNESAYVVYAGLELEKAIFQTQCFLMVKCVFHWVINVLYSQGVLWAEFIL